MEEIEENKMQNRINDLGETLEKFILFDLSRLDIDKKDFYFENNKELKKVNFNKFISNCNENIKLKPKTVADNCVREIFNISTELKQTKTSIKNSLRDFLKKIESVMNNIVDYESQIEELEGVIMEKDEENTNLRINIEIREKELIQKENKLLREINKNISENTKNTEEIKDIPKQENEKTKKLEEFKEIEEIEGIEEDTTEDIKIINECHKDTLNQMKIKFPELLPIHKNKTLDDFQEKYSNEISKNSELTKVDLAIQKYKEIWSYMSIRHEIEDEPPKFLGLVEYNEDKPDNYYDDILELYKN